MKQGLLADIASRLRKISVYTQALIKRCVRREEKQNGFRPPNVNAEFFKKLTYFDGDAYFRLNPDLPRSINPFWHVAEHGLSEGRRLFSVDAIAKAVLVPSKAASRPQLLDASGSLAKSKFLILVSSLGNFFMRELAERLAADLRSVGAAVELADEKRHARISKDITVVVVAPHEFFLLGKEGARWQRLVGTFDFYAFNTEQPQTPWFSQCFRFLLSAKGIIDLSPQTASLLAEAGLHTCHYVPGSAQGHTLYDHFKPHHHPLLQAYPDLLGVTRSSRITSAPRPLDVSFIGGPSARRERFLSTSAHQLSHWRCLIDYKKGLSAPIRWEKNSMHEIGFGHFLARHSKIYLNVHRDEFGFFEIHRMVIQGIANGAAVVTDTCLPHPDFVPGVHYFEEEFERIPQLIEWLLKSSEGREKRMAVARVGHDAYMERWSSAAVNKLFTEFFEAS